MQVGDLVKTTAGTKHHGAVGLVVNIRPRWPDPREEEVLATVFYPDTREQVDWSERNLEILSASR